METWIRSWWDRERGDLVTLTPNGWLDEGQGQGCFLWAPPPAAADVAAEQLGEAKHKRTNCTHITVVPRLMTGRWRKVLAKESDFSVAIPAGRLACWPASMHEPLILFVSLPLCSYAPWSYRRTSFVEGLCWELRAVWESGPERSGNILRELLLQERNFQSLPEDMVRKLLRSFDWRSVSNKSSGGRRRVRKRRKR